MNKFIHFIMYIFCLSYLSSQWLQQTLPVNKPITGIEFVDTLKGWACTDRGTPADTGYILYTSNSGTNWFVQFKKYNVAFYDIEIVNNQRGYAGGFLYTSGYPVLYKTTNGGLNWDSVSININHFIDDIFFVNEDSGWTCSALFGPDVRTTTDGGNTWIVRTSGITQPTNRIFFLNYDTGICTSFGFLYRTTNAGLNWELRSSFAEGVYSLFFLNINTGWVGMNNRKIRFTSNGGANWVEQQNPQYFGTITSLQLINSTIGWAGGGLDYIYKTTNGGLLWGYQLNYSGANRFCFIDSLNGWSAGTASARGVCHTTNGGGEIYYVGITNLSNNIPQSFTLYQNYPNPFNPTTSIRFDIKTSSQVKLSVFDVLGREMKTLVDEKLRPGIYEYKWDARKLTSGCYFYTLISDGFRDTKKMILSK